MRRLIRRSVVPATALLLAALLAACATAPPRAPATTLPELRLAPAALGRELATQQRLYFEFGPAGRPSVQRELDALLEVDANQVQLAVQALGQSGVRLRWDGRALEQQRAAWLPPTMRGERVLADLQFALWPADAIRAALPAPWMLQEEGTVRRLERGGTAWLQVEDLGAGRYLLDNRADGYRLRIESADAGIQAP